jgi:hypothetical protein
MGENSSPSTPHDQTEGVSEIEIIGISMFVSTPSGGHLAPWVQLKLQQN